MISAALFTPALSIVKYTADPYEQLPAIVYWLMSSLGGIDMTQIRWVIIPILGGLVVLVLFGRPLDALSMGDNEARVLAQRIAYVPQAHVVPFLCSVRDVVMLGRLAETGMFRAPKASDRHVMNEVLDRLAIMSLAERPYIEISGGERQLTLIARRLRKVQVFSSWMSR